jgi:hypothetical protein
MGIWKTSPEFKRLSSLERREFRQGCEDLTLLGEV